MFLPWHQTEASGPLRIFTPFKPLLARGAGALGRIANGKMLVNNNMSSIHEGKSYRAIPLYIAAILIIFFLSNTVSLVPSSSPLTDAANTPPLFINSPSTLSIPGETQFVSPGKFPKKIWQSWKVDPLNFAERDLTVARSWGEKNPRYRYEVLTDSNDEQYVEDNFGPDGFNRPDIVDMYNNLTTKIIKADLLRYLVIYAEGGVYADIDVEAIRPIERFIPARYREDEMDMIIGVEIDEPDFNEHPILGQKSQSFCQWTFVAKPRHPVMMRLVDNILIWLNKVASEQNVPISDIKLDFDQVLSGTGPSAFTIAMLAHMSEVEGKEIKWDQFHALDESKIIGKILVLTVEAFAAGQGHSDSGNHDSRHALVRHNYHASKWPKAHPRYKHPVYGEVERCNWKKPCIDKWDADKIAFDALSPEEQDVQIEHTKSIDPDVSVVELEDQLPRIGVVEEEQQREGSDGEQQQQEENGGGEEQQQHGGSEEQVHIQEGKVKV